MSGRGPGPESSGARGAGPGPAPPARASRRRRRTARRTAIDILYQADVTGAPPSAILEQWRGAGRKVAAYAADVVAGVEQDLPEIDRVLGEHAESWTVQRMAVVDRTILRVALYELRAGLPAAVVINEAVEAAKELSTEDSGRFINGILGRIVRNGADGKTPGEQGWEEAVSPRSSGRPTDPPRSRLPSDPA